MTMNRVRLPLAVLLLLALLMLPVFSSASYPYDDIDEINLKIVFVGFPGNAAGPQITVDFHGEMVTQFAEYLELHSGGALTLSEDSGILFLPDQSFDGSPVADAWIAGKRLSNRTYPTCAA